MPGQRPPRRAHFHLMDEATAVCPCCREPVEPTAPSVIYAVHMVETPGFGQTHEWIEGLPAYFHPDCPPELVGYARRRRPAAA
jgi:hypothetical protein